MVDGSLQVAEGDQVTEGDTLGLMGATGNVTGKHLHFMLFSRAIGDPAWPEFSLTDLGYGYTKKPYGKVFVWEETRFYDPLDLLYTLQERNQPAPPREVADPPQNTNGYSE